MSNETYTRKQIEDWAATHGPGHARTIDYMLCEFDAEQARDAEAERVASSMWRGLYPELTWERTDEKTRCRWVKVVSKALDEYRSAEVPANHIADAGKMVSEQRLRAAEPQKLPCKCDRCGKLLCGLCPECDRIVEADCAEPKQAACDVTAEELAEIVWRETPGDDGDSNEWVKAAADAIRPYLRERKVKARIIHDSDGQHYWHLEGKARFGIRFLDSHSAKKDLESIMAAAGATVDWQEGGGE